MSRRPSFVSLQGAPRSRIEMGKTSNETAVSGSIWEAEETSLPPAFGLDEAADNEQRRLAHAGGSRRRFAA